MPSPLGHLLAGSAVYLAGAGQRRSRLLLVVALLGSLAADFDFVPGILIGNMRAFHRGMSHSFAFALLFGLLVFAVAHVVRSTAAPQAALIAGCAYAVHVVLDFISVNPGVRGVPLFWPLHGERLGINLHLFGHFRYGDISEGIWSVLRWVNVGPFLRETLILGAVVLLLWAARWRRRHLTARRPPARNMPSA
jgi:hypothetical protein